MTKRIEKQKSAFTLGEVLIALAIIGVIAAVTLPTLIKNYQHKVLEVKFKQSLSIMQNAIIMAREELGVQSFNQYCTFYQPDKGNFGYMHARECELAFMNQLIKLSSSKCRYSSSDPSHCNPHSITRNSSDLLTFNGKNTIISSLINGFKYTNSLPNSSFVGLTTNSGLFFISIDLNGYTKPNRFGNDMFMLRLDKNDNIAAYSKANNNITDEQAEEKYKDATSNKDYLINIYGNPCNLESSRSGNGVGCAYYALRNKCPWDSTKTYWECLP